MSTRPIQAVMITMKGREETTKATAAQFKKIGLPPKIFTQPANKPVGAVSNRWNGSRAIKYALEQEADCLFIEDDLEVNPGRLLRAIETWQAKLSDCPMYLYLNEDQPRVGAWYSGEDLKLLQ